MASRVALVRPLAVEAARRTIERQNSEGVGEAVSALALAGDVEGLAALRAAMGDWRDEELLTALAGAFARAGDPARAREAAQAVASEESDESYESAAWMTLVKGLVAAGLFDAARSAAVDNRYESRVTGIAIVVDALAGRGDAPDTLMPLARRTIAEASGMTGEFGQAQAYAEISTLLAERGERERARRLLDRAEAEVASIPPGGMALGTSRALACAHARLGAYDRAMERFSVWKDKAAGWRVLLEHLRALGPSAPADAAEAELKALIAVASDHDTLLLAADMARSVGDLEQMRHYLEQARAAAQADRSVPLQQPVRRHQGDGRCRRTGECPATIGHARAAARMGLRHPARAGGHRGGG